MLLIIFPRFTPSKIPSDSRPDLLGYLPAVSGKSLILHAATRVYGQPPFNPSKPNIIQALLFSFDLPLSI